MMASCVLVSYLLALIASCLVVLSLLDSLSNGSNPTSSRHLTIQNKTMGLGKVFVVGDPNRLRHRDELSLISVASNIAFTYTDAEDGELLVPRQLPYMNGGVHSIDIGRWRSHLNAWRTMLDSNLDTALFLEDDVDFDIDVRSQLLAFALALEKSSNVKLRRHNSPFAGSWDIIWLATCNSSVGNLPTAVAYHDATVPMANETDPKWSPLLRAYGIRDRQTRIIQASATTNCLSSYILSRHGAAKLFYAASRSLTQSLQRQISLLVEQHSIASISILPPLMSPYRLPHEPDGGFIGIQATSDDHRNPSSGRARGVRSKASVRQTLETLLDGLEW